MNPTEPPEGCVEIPGYFLTISGVGWFKKDGGVTRVFSERGVWETQEDAQKAIDEFTKE